MNESLRIVRSYPRVFWTFLCLGCAVGGVIAGGVWMFQVLDRPPVIILNSRLLTAEVHRDAWLQFEVRQVGHMGRGCTGAITREFFRPIVVDGADRREKMRTGGPAPIVQDGETAYVIDVPLPPNMPAGAWTFQGETSYDCGIWGLKRYRTSEMPFVVTGAR